MRLLRRNKCVKIYELSIKLRKSSETENVKHAKRRKEREIREEKGGESKARWNIVDNAVILG